ncbi:acylneuraminate cytidylyltransferase family protein [Polaribacter septentrionalilitoris]|uniref:acylneuraminate cytidylyltransferase family protein n=1 Tax=Polaribacter septentrionalilitoris TaxID=2494657 RepID=UPI00135BF97F|nr:acylneuraminate cytidylyltransferase family protein [Polaribacter septentrionalilitoris]
MKIVALMPMKGTSERVPHKNLKSFNGKPLYHIVMETLFKSKYINEVVVNTDGEKLKKDILTCFDNKVTIIDRNQAIRGNYVSMNKIIEHDIHAVKADIYIQTHSTNPLLKTETLDAAIEKMMELLEIDENASVFSVSKTQKRFYNQDATPMNHDPKMLVTQHLDPIYEENSCFYIFTKHSFMNNDSRIGTLPYMFEVDKIESTDIDEPEDFIIAEALHKLLR